MELQRRGWCLCHCKSVDLSSGTCMHGGFCKAWLKLGMPKCTGTQGISRKIDINGSCCYVSGWVMRSGLLCWWIRRLNEVSPLSQPATADKTSLRYFMLLFNSVPLSIEKEFMFILSWTFFFFFLQPSVFAMCVFAVTLLGPSGWIIHHIPEYRQRSRPQPWLPC